VGKEARDRERVDVMIANDKKNLNQFQTAAEIKDKVKKFAKFGKKEPAESGKK
jgi:hypothetical protein